MTSKPTLDPRVSPAFSPPSSFTPPSVPLSVYRDLVKELQSTRGRLDSLEVQNSQLIKDNRQLRKEIEKVVHQGRYLARVVQTLDATRDNAEPSFVIPVRPRLVTPPSRTPPTREIPPQTPPASIETNPESSPHGWMMVLVVLVVVLTSGLGAFWLVSSTKR